MILTSTDLSFDEKLSFQLFKLADDLGLSSLHGTSICSTRLFRGTCRSTHILRSSFIALLAILLVIVGNLRVGARIIVNILILSFIVLFLRLGIFIFLLFLPTCPYCSQSEQLIGILLLSTLVASSLHLFLRPKIRQTWSSNLPSSNFGGFCQLTNN